MEEPHGFRLPDQMAFGACPASRQGGTTGPGDPNERWWAMMCEEVGLSLEDLPWVMTVIDEQRVRLYFNAGVFAYRRSSGLLQTYDSCTRQILKARIASQQTGILFVDQVALPLAVAKLGLRYQAWPERYNFNVGHGLDKFYRGERMREARILHYHNYMKGEEWPRLLRMLENDRPAVAQWLAPYGPIHEKRIGGPRDLMRTAFKAYRKVRTTWYERARGRRY